MSELVLGTPDRPLTVAVVGSGPSAFYAVEALFKAEKLFGRAGSWPKLSCRAVS